MKKKRISFVGLYNDTNLGDPVIAHCTEWLFTNGIDVEISRVFLDGPQDTLNSAFLYKVECKLRNIFQLDYPKTKYIHKIYQRGIDYFRKQIRGNDLVVMVGGGLIKYKYQVLGVEAAALCVACEKEEINLIINAVGIEGYDDGNIICRIIKQAFRSKTLKYISTRDDITLLKQNYLDKNEIVKCERVADPAVWASEAYGITKDPYSVVIGLGIARSNLFLDNEHEVGEEQIIDLYEEIATILIDRGYTISLFTNGLSYDNNTAKQVQERLALKGMRIELRIPTNDKKLVETISCFKAVIATRLHSCIISYSLGIPAIGLVWNEKLSFFGDCIGTPENFIEPEHFDAIHIVNSMEKAIAKGYDFQRKLEFKATIKNNVSKIQKDYLS